MPAALALDRLRRLTIPAIVFIVLTVTSVVVFGVLYAGEVREALALRGTFACIADSMMRQSCEHPYSSSFFWSMLLFVFAWWPLLVAWLLSGIFAVFWPYTPARKRSSARLNEQ